MKNKGTLYMIPCPIVEHKNDSIPEETRLMTHRITHFVVERARTARRWLSSLSHPVAIAELHIFELDKNNPSQDLTPILSKLEEGIDIGVISEAGCPGIADPGHRAVQYAHRQGHKVSSLVGPSSILMALMASGFNGQGFTFHGYLPNKNPILKKKIVSLESMLHQTGQTQIFMEAPYRNGFMIDTLTQSLSSHTLLCIACDINANSESILTLPSKEWKKVNSKDYHKRPTIYLIGNY